ncbi:hypothetical protein EF888_14975 [Silicimonas algicola]|uniref:MmgE/PrpD family protein n=1 Tax=Silicimonas algicola TaxID=1826607 RepID=A0A316FV88_9RHOB|nr:MmgE/PrpD family protein [Silicimonas algicola]AZQ68323.1 hypothetical protein EF888_14975 [Silicimonas algicola]PWK52704.1 MmgE/PrpD family protein [Silicimonas algicola]
MSIVYSVRPCRPEARPAPEEQLAWARADLAASNRPLDADAAALAGCRLIDNMAIAVASLDRSPVAAAPHLDLESFGPRARLDGALADVRSTDRAMRGVTAPSPIYEGDYGILAVLLGGQEAEVTLPGQGEPCRAILDTLTKAHSAGYHGQAIIDLALRLHGQLGDLYQVETITIHTKRMTHVVMGSGSGDPDKWDPRASRETLDYSAPFQFARALVDGDWHHDRSYDPALISDPAFVRLWGKVRTVEDEEWNRRFAAVRPIDKDHGGRAVIRFADGREQAEELAVANSHPRGASPWEFEDYHRKFKTLTEPFLSQEKGERFVVAARDLAKLSTAEVRILGVEADLRPPAEGAKGLLDRSPA